MRVRDIFGRFKKRTDDATTVPYGFMVTLETARAINHEHVISALEKIQGVYGIHVAALGQVSINVTRRLAS
jgi:hypothetical protein